MTSAHVVFLHPHPLPSPHAALVRIARLGGALQARGLRVELWSGPTTRTSGGRAVLSNYGVLGQPIPHVRAVFGARRSDWARDLDRALLGAPEDRTVIARGVDGARLVANCLEHRGVRWILELHRPPSLDVRWRPWPRLALRSTMRRALRRADGLVCVSAAVVDELARTQLRTSAGSVLVLPSGAPTPVESLPADRERDLDVIYAGKLEPRKGVDDLLRAWRHVREHKLTVVGGLPEQVRRYRSLARRIGVDDRVDFLGHVDACRIPSLLARARVAVCPLPSTDPVAARYTSPLKAMEALSAGTPLVATNVAPITDLVGPDEGALIVPSDDESELAAGVRRLLEDRVLARRLAQRGLEIAARNTWDRRASSFEEFLGTR